MSEKKNKILVADDEKEIRDILKLLLSSEGYEVTLACDGQEVLDLADDSFDMFILDVNMPKISGFSAGAKLRVMISRLPEPDSRTISVSPSRSEICCGFFTNG